MQVGMIVAGAALVLAFAYLVYVLLYPEKF